jgi:glucose-6-phosphate 1-epimerase
VLFLSERSAFSPEKAIRGGIPICFPWFGGRGGGLPGPSHGFARILPWQLSFAALMPSEPGEETLHLVLTLEPDAGGVAQSFGYNRFRVACEFSIGRTLAVRFSVVNLGTEPLTFEEALHTYFHVGDVRRATITGLEGAKFLDKRDDMREKTEPVSALRLAGSTDRVYPANTATTQIHDEVLARTLTIAKENSSTTVVWNPWDEGAKTMGDLDPAAWPQFLCVETANAGSAAITLASGEAHTMQLTVSLGE